MRRWMIRGRQSPYRALSWHHIEQSHVTDKWHAGFEHEETRRVHPRGQMLFISLAPLASCTHDWKPLEAKSPEPHPTTDCQQCHQCLQDGAPAP